MIEYSCPNCRRSGRSGWDGAGGIGGPRISCVTRPPQKSPASSGSSTLASYWVTGS